MREQGSVLSWAVFAIIAALVSGEAPVFIGFV
jgi:hypothetical protein